MPIYSAGYMPGVESNDRQLPMVSSIGMGPKGEDGADGHSVLVSTIPGEPYGCYRLQFVDSVTGEVLGTTPNLDPGSRTYVCTKEFNDSTVTYTARVNEFTTQQLGTIRDARVGDIVVYKAIRHIEGTDSTYHSIGLGVITSIANNGMVTFVPHMETDTVIIPDNSVTTRKLANGAVTTPKLADESVATPKLANNSITTQKVVDRAITNQKLADNSVSTNKIANKAVTTQKIADGAITSEKISGGSMSSIIVGWLNEHPQYVTTEASRAYNTVLDMKSDMEISTGMICHTNGFNSSGDGGAAWYVITNSSNPNEMDTISCDNNLTAELIIDDIISIKQLGCTGGSVIDCYDYVMRGVSLAVARNIPLVFDEGSNYYTNQNIVIDDAVDIDMRGRIKFGGSGVALTLTSSNNRLRKNKLRISIDGTYSISDVPSNTVGCIIKNAYSCDITLDVSNFETCVELHGDADGMAYNSIHIEELCLCKNNLILRAINDGWINDNQFYDGRLWNSTSGMYYTLNNAITLDASNSVHDINANVFNKTSIEHAKVGITCINASFNTFNDIRFENDETSIQEDVQSYGNKYHAGYAGGVVNAINSAYDDINITNRFKAITGKYQKQVFDSGFLPDKCFSNGSALVVPTDMFTTRGRSSEEPLKVNARNHISGTKTNSNISWTSGNYNIGILVGLSMLTYSGGLIDYFIAIQGTKQNTKAQYFVVLLNENLEAISTPNSVTGAPDDFFNISTTIVPNSLPCYVSTSKRNFKALSIKSQDAVYAIFGIKSLDSDLVGFSVYEPIAQNSRIVSPTIFDSNLIYCGLDSIPTCEGHDGQFCPAIGSATELGWIMKNSIWTPVYNGTSS